MSVTLTEVWSSAGQKKVGRSGEPAAKCVFVACVLCHTPLGALEVPLYNQRNERVATGYWLHTGCCAVLQFYIDHC